MASYTWGLLCRRAIVDVATNTVSYIDAAEEFAVSELPVRAPIIIAGTLWRRTAESEQSIEVQARVESPDGESLVGESVLLALEPHHNRGRINIGIGGYELPRAGRYHVVIEQRKGDSWEEATRLPFDVNLRADATDTKARAEQPTDRKTPAPRARARGRKRRSPKKSRT
jgi:hypothetical protein